jgi:hypothetical protein
MRNTNLLALAAALILGCVWWTNSTPTKAAAPRGVQIDASQAIGVQNLSSSDYDNKSVASN